MPTGIYKRTKENNRINSLSKVGRKKSAQHAKNISLAIRGDKHWSWKGEEASYSSMHKWVVRELGNPSHCAYCNSITKKRYEWANISRTYKRELSDYIRLCNVCHSAYDRGKIDLDGN